MAAASSTPGAARWGRRRGVGADADTESVADTATSWDVIEGEVVEDKKEAYSNNTAFWGYAVWYLIRLAKKKIFWHCGGTALNFIAERRKRLNKGIDAELKAKADLALKSEHSRDGKFSERSGTSRAFANNGIKSGTDGAAAGARRGGRATR